MPTQTSPRTADMTRTAGCYLYAVVDGASDPRLGPFGIDGGMVYTIRDGDLAAVVSDLANARLRPERRRLAAHHAVLRRLLESATVLPMAFGLIADGPEAVHRILAANREALTDNLRRLAGTVEMGLHVAWDVPNIFEYFVDSDEDLRRMRDQLFRGGREPNPDDKVELGRTFDRALADRRDEHAAKVQAVLRPYCVEIKHNRCRNEREVMHLACLVERGRQAAFEQGVFEAARCFDHHYAFDFNGPWPPHSFVDVALQS